MISFIKQIFQELRKTTRRKKLQLFTFLTIIFFFALVSVFRMKIYDYITEIKIHSSSPSVTTLTYNTQSQLNHIVEFYPHISAITVTMVDFRKNERYVIHASVYNPMLKDLAIRKGIGTYPPQAQPLFTNNNAYNKRLIELINGNFICRPYLETPGISDVPGSEKYISTVCSKGIPPHYGKFVGIISIFLSKEPNSLEVDQLRTLLNTLSSTIHDRDLQ